MMGGVACGVAARAAFQVFGQGVAVDPLFISRAGAKAIVKLALAQALSRWLDPRTPWWAHILLGISAGFIA